MKISSALVEKVVHLSKSALLLGGLLAVIGWEAVRAEEGKPIQVADVQHDGPVDFEKEILPILSRNCLACHNASKPESELVLESPQTILNGGYLGPAVVPGKPDESLLMLVASHRDEPVMPPEDNTVGAKNLTSEELGLLQLWISQGAKGSVNQSGKAINWQPLPETVNPIFAVAVSPDGRQVAANRANRLYLYNIAGRILEDQLIDPELDQVPAFQGRHRAHADIVNSLTFSPDGEWVVSGAFRELKFWKHPDRFTQQDLITVDGGVRSLAISPDRSRAAVGDAAGNLRFVDLKNGKASTSWAGHQGAVTGLAFTADGQHLLSGSADQTLRLWNSADGAPAGAIRTAAPIIGLVLPAKGNEVLVAGLDGVARVYAMPELAAEVSEPLPEGSIVRTIEIPGGTLLSVAPADSNGGTAVIGGRDGQARVVDISSGKELKRVSHGAPVVAVAWRGDGKQLATAADNGTVKLWNLDDGKLVADLSTFPEDVTRLAQFKHQVALTQLELRTAREDLANAEKKARDEQEGAYTSAVDLTKVEVQLKQKLEALEKATAEKAAADKAVADLKSEQAQVEATIKNLEAAPPAEDDPEAKKKHAEDLKKARDALNAVNSRLASAEKEAGNANKSFGKAEDEKVIADLAVKAARRTMKNTQKSADQSKAAIAEYQAKMESLRSKVISAQLAQAEFERAGRIRKSLINDHVAEVRARGQSLRQAMESLQSSPLNESEQAAEPAAPTQVQLDAQKAEQAAEEAWMHARREFRQIQEDAQGRIIELNLEKSRIQEALNDARNRNQAAVTARDAASKPLNGLEAKLKNASDDGAKMMANVELQNATHRKTALDEEVVRTEEAVKSGTAALEEIEKQLAAAQAQAKDLPQAANAQVQELLAALNEARQKRDAADREAGGRVAVLKTARERYKSAEAALAELVQPVTVVKFSPDNHRLLVASEQEARLYGTADGEPLGSRPANPDGFAVAEFVNDRDLLAASAKNSLSLFDTTPDWVLGRRIGDGNDPSILEGPVMALDISPDGALLATGSGDASRNGELKIWDIATGDLVRSIEGAHSDLVMGVKFSPDGKLVASCSADRFMKIFDVETGKEVKSFEGHTSHVLGVDWRLDGRLLATTGGDMTCKIWDFQSGETTRSISGYKQDVTALQFLGASDQFVTASGVSSQVIIRNIGGGSGPVFPGPTGFIYCVRANEDGSVVAAGGDNSVLRVWRVQGNAAKDVVTFPPQTAP